MYMNDPLISLGKVNLASWQSTSSHASFSTANRIAHSGQSNLGLRLDVKPCSRRLQEFLPGLLLNYDHESCSS